jgi:ankyrin repeat protein
MATFYNSQTSTDVCSAAWNNNIKYIEQLIVQERQQFGLDSNSGFGPLHFAASLGNLEIVNRLLATGLVNRDARDKDGNTALMWVVAANGSDELLEALIDNGVDLNIQNYIGETALFIAASRGYTEKVEFLLENGARTQISNLDGATPLHAAAAGGHEEVVSALINYGAFLNVGDDEDDTPLHWAVREGQKRIISILVSAGCEVNAVNGDGETPLALAMAFDAQDIIDWLASMGGQETDVVLPKPTQHESTVPEVEKMEVEMKNLSVRAVEDGRLKPQRKDVVGIRSAPFGSTPPALSFVF